MKIKAAKITKKGITLAVAQINDRKTLEDRELAMHIIRSMQRVFPEMHVVLWYWEPGGEPVFFGRPDVAQRLSDLAPASVPWEEHEIPDPE